MEHMGREKKQKKNIRFDGESDLPRISWWADGPSWRFLMFSAAGSVDLLFKRDLIGGCDHEQSGI